VPLDFKVVVFLVMFFSGALNWDGYDFANDTGNGLFGIWRLEKYVTISLQGCGSHTLFVV
jgi:hypothetical protein